MDHRRNTKYNGSEKDIQDFYEGVRGQSLDEIYRCYCKN